jgi:hypothetical protein
LASGQEKIGKDAKNATPFSLRPFFGAPYLNGYGALAQRRAKVFWLSPTLKKPQVFF